MSNNADALLSGREHEAVALLGQARRLIAESIGDGPTRRQDLAEADSHIHALQQMILSQAAARAYPDLYRLLGEELP